MTEQLRLAGTDVPCAPLRLRPSVCALGLAEVHKIRAELASKESRIRG